MSLDSSTSSRCQRTFHGLPCPVLQLEAAQIARHCDAQHVCELEQELPLLALALSRGRVAVGLQRQAVDEPLFPASQKSCGPEGFVDVATRSHTLTTGSDCSAAVAAVFAETGVCPCDKMSTAYLLALFLGDPGA